MTAFLLNVEYGIGCGLSMWRYEGKTIDIDIGGSFLDGIGDRIYLFDSGRDCKVWDAKDLGSSGGGFSGGSTYIPPAPTTPSCPANSSFVNGQCTCNAGYTANAEKSACIQILSCPEGFVLNTSNQCITYTQSCQTVNNNDPNIFGTKGENGKINCNCISNYYWNGSQCVKNITTETQKPPIVETKKTEPIIQNVPKKIPVKESKEGSKVKTSTSLSPSSTPVEKTATSTNEDNKNPTTVKIPWYKKIFNFFSGLLK
jgi:hypothetical protein